MIDPVFMHLQYNNSYYKTIVFVQTIFLLFIRVVGIVWVTSKHIVNKKENFNISFLLLNKFYQF